MASSKSVVLKDPPISLATQFSRIGRRRGVRALAFGLALLGLCVFAWGLRYKLSLYDPPHSIASHMPEAKLLSGRERVGVQGLNLRRAAPGAMPFFLNASVSVAFAPPALRLSSGPRAWAELVSRVSHFPGSGRDAPLFVRPPPSFL